MQKESQKISIFVDKRYIEIKRFPFDLKVGGGGANRSLFLYYKMSIRIQSDIIKKINASCSVEDTDLSAIMAVDWIRIYQP